MTAFFDIDTQLDFLFPAGALYVPGAENLVGKIAALNRHAAARSVALFSTMDAHAENDPEFSQWPPHCVVGTFGQWKPASTWLDARVVVPSRPAHVDTAPQMLIEKQTTDCFTNSNLVGLLDRLGVTDCLVYGVVTEICVKNAVLGLLRSGRKVQIVTDAVAALDPESAGQFLTGLSTTTVAAVLERASGA